MYLLIFISYLRDKAICKIILKTVLTEADNISSALKFQAKFGSYKSADQIWP